MDAQLLGCMSSPGSSVRGILQAGILEWVAFSSSRGSSQPRHQTCVTYVSCTGWQVLAPAGKPILYTGNSYEHFTHFKPLQPSREYQRLVVLPSAFCRQGTEGLSGLSEITHLRGIRVLLWAQAAWPQPLCSPHIPVAVGGAGEAATDNKDGSCSLQASNPCEQDFTLSPLLISSTHQKTWWRPSFSWVEYIFGLK